ncbi:zinc ribbon domain-containing protein [Halorubrum sp. SS5]|nr:zinc ribbon domain-containing protein [Halorubrum sp. SS5]
MTGDQLLPLAAIFVGVAALNLAVTWLLVRRNRDPAELLGSAAARSSDGDGEGPEIGPTLALDGDGDGGSASGAGEPDGDGPPPLDAAGETVVCRHCGAENRSGYRYCRWCVRSGFVDEDAGVTAGTAMADRSL